MDVSERRKKLQEMKQQRESANSSASVSGGSSGRRASLTALKMERAQASIPEITSRVDTWLKNNETYFSNAKNRFSSENTTYRTGVASSQWLSTVSKQRENFQKEAESIKSALNQYKDVFGQEYVNSVIEALDGNLKAQESIIEASKQDLDYWSQFANKDEYDTAQRYYGYQQNYAGKSYNEIVGVLKRIADGEEKEWLKANRYNILSTSSDFAEKSQYKTTYRGGEKFNSWAGMYTDTGYDDIMYDYINGDKRAIDRQAVSDIATNAAFLGLDNSERREMEEEEVAIFNYLYATQGSETAYEYIKYLTSDLNARQRDTEQKKWAEYAKESPVGSSLFSVFTSPLKGLSYVGQIGDYMQDGAIDQNAGYNKFSYINSAIRDEVSKIAEANWGGVGSFAYQTGMSMGDFLFSTAVSGGNSALSLAIMGTGAASDTVISAKDRGLEDWQAFTLGTIAGAAEIAMEKIGLDALFDTAKLGKGALGYVLNNALSEGGEEVGTELINTLADILIAQDKSQFLTEYNYYMSQGESGLEAFGHALGDKLILAGLGGAVSGGILGGGGAVVGTIGQTIKGSEMQKDFGSGIGADLTAEALEIDPSNRFAQKMQSKLASGKTLSNRQIGKLVQQNERGMYDNDVASIQKAVESRLAELGEKGDVKVIATALAKQVQGERLTFTEREAIKSSTFGQRVANELNTDNIKSGEYSSSWAEKIGTDRINAEEYSRLIRDMEAPAETASEEKAVETVEPVADAAESAGVAEPTDAGEAQAVSAPENAPTNEIATESRTEPAVVDEDTAALQNASEEYGAQAGAMVSTYAKGQDVVKYDAAYKAAYDMGKSGVNLSYAMQSESTAYLTEQQRKLAHAAGVDASKADAEARDAKNKEKINGKTGRRKGTVRGDGVSIADLKKSFNDTQGVAYKLLSTYAEATGVDIVLYTSEMTADGDFEGAQGKFKADEDTIYIDVNAGLVDIGSVGNLAKYTMMRTFSHEFTHFIEKWNPIWYNEFRKVVFDTLTERGENVEALIAEKQEQTGKSYDYASREVVAEAMVDILPDANFVEELATNHKNIFQKLLEMLKEFVADLKAHFASLDRNTSREAKALKEQVGESVKYVESIVKLFDKVALEAVENYQKTVAVEETAQVEQTAEATESEADGSETVKTTEREHFTITDDAENKVTSIKFDGKPSDTVRGILRNNAFIWSREKGEWFRSGKWYGKSNVNDVISALDQAYTAEESTVAPATEKTATETLREMGGKAVGDNMTDVTDLFFPELAKKEAPKAEKAKPVSTKKSDWASHDVEWHVPGKKTPIAYSTRAASDLIEALAEDNPSATIKELLGQITYDVEAKKVLQQYIDAGYGNQVANEWFNHNKQEVKPNVENADNQGTVQQPDTDRQGASRLLDEVEAGDVQGAGTDGQSVEPDRAEGSGAGRHDTAADSAAGDRGSDGSGESGDLRNDGLTEPTEELTVEEAKEQTERETEAVERDIEQKSTVEPKGRNFVIGDSLDLPSGEKSKFRANVDAIRLIKQLETEGRYATEAEQVILSKYVGWGGLDKAFGEMLYNRETRKSEMTAKKGWEKEFAELRALVDEGIITEQEYKDMSASTKNAHYTSIEVIKAMYDGLASLGFKGGSMLEPSSGVGNFVGAMPAAMSEKVNSWTMVELDRITGQIAKYLYPNADVRIQGFETANIPDNYMDVAIGNVPFGNFGVVDRAYPKRITKSIHNYFFAKSLDKVRPGGIVMFITSSFTMDASDSAVRKYIMERADLLGAIRLPNTAFDENAGTQVVTDILVLKKRKSGTEYSGENFLDAEYKYEYGTHVSSYFEQHPEMVLGKAVTKRGMYGANTLTYEPLTDKGTIDEQIREAFKNINGEMSYPEKLSREKTNFAVERENKKTKAGGYVVNPDGSISKKENGQLVKVDADEKTAKRIAGMLSIRDAYRKLASYLQQGLIESEIKKARKELNTAYDKFVKEFGYINAPTNKRAIASDPDRYSIYSLELYDEEKKIAKKADIFTKDTISANKTVTHVDSVEEGVLASINLTGGVDIELIAKLTDKAAADVTRDIIDSRLAFKTRDGVLVAREAYLSGNVRAKLREAEALLPYDADYSNNVEELRRVIPADIPYNEIYITPGSTFIPNEVYADFIAHILGGRNNNYYGSPDVEVGRTATGEFKIVINNKRLKSNYRNNQEWGTARKSFLDLIDAMMGSRTIKVNDTMETADGRKISVVNEAETEAANEKVKAIQKEFEEWIWKDEDRRNALAKLYNELFNAHATPKYDGSTLSVNGINPVYTLMEHQANAVHRIVASGGNTLLAHRVGAGKTLEMASAAMKLRELGVVKKPVFVVPKSVVAQWGVEFSNYFPAAKLLVSDEKSFTPANRKVFTNMIANGDYDAVILTYEQFEKIPMSAEYQTKFYEEQINEIIEAIAEEKAESRDGKGLTVKEMEKKKAQLEKKLKELTSKPKDEDNIDFEMLGIDSLFVDEAHNFKNLEYVSKMTNVAGLGTTKGVQRAFDLYTKVRYLQGLNGGRGIVFATATPVMNSMVELYIMQRYLQPDVLNQLGLKSFDAWAKQFGEVVNKWEINPSGTGMRQKQVFANFRNLNELQLLFRSFADVVTDLPHLKIPKQKGGKVNIVECEPGEFQRNYMQALQKRAENVKSVDPSEDNMLKITSDGRKVSYTQRMIDPSLPYEPDCKIFRASENILKEYKESADIKGTQVVFLDMATPKGTDKSKVETSEEAIDDALYDEGSAKLYEDMRNYLVKKGIPKREIAFIHEADTDAKRKKLFADVNEGKVRVLIGSTGKMGVGMNAQKRIVAIHHLDAPWRPGDVEQRDGRAFRQGNINSEVAKYVYVTKGSFDSRLWDILDRKQHFINQIMNGEDVGRTVEDTGEVTLSAAEIKALASGNPLIEEQTKLTDELKKLENLRKAHNSSMTLARTKLSDDIAKIAKYESSIEKIREDISARKDTYSEGKFSINIGGKQYTDKKEAGVALAAEISAKANKEAYVTVAKFAGFELRVIKDLAEYKGVIHGKENYKFNVYMNNTTRMVNHIGEVIAGFENIIKNYEQFIADITADRDAQQEILKQPFAKQAELDQKRARFNEVMELLAPKTEEQLGKTADEDTVQEQSRSYLKDNDYSTDGVHWGVEAGIMTNADARVVWEAVVNIKKKGYKGYQRTINGDYFVESNNLLMVVDADYHNPLVKTIYQFNDDHETNMAKAKELLKNEKGNPTGNRNALRTINALYGDGYVEQYDSAVSRTHAGQDGRREGANRGAGYSEAESREWDFDEQYQERTNTLSDREVLAFAADRLEEEDRLAQEWNEEHEKKKSTLTVAEKDALRIFKQRLSKLEELQDERKEQGQLYKEQQFGANVNREEAKQTLNRMQILDEQIKKAKADVLSLEDKQVFENLLKKARKVVETEQRTHDAEVMQRYRERTKEAAAVKKYKNRVEKDVGDLKGWIESPNNKDVVKHVPIVVKDTVVDFLKTIDFTSNRQLEGGEATKADQALEKQMERLRAAMVEQTKGYGERYSDYMDLPPGFVERLNGFVDQIKELANSNKSEYVINKMTSEELKQLSEVVRTLKKYITQINKFHHNAVYHHVYEAGEALIEYTSPMESDGGKTGEFKNFVYYKNARPSVVFERFGRPGMAIRDELQEGQDKFGFNAKVIVDFAEKTFKESEVKAYREELHTFDIGGEKVTMRTSHIMGLYLLWKQPDSHRHIIKGGLRVGTFKQQKGKKIYSSDSHILTQGEVERILGKLTQRQKDVADAIQKFMAEQGAEWGNEISVKRFGEMLFTETSYYPIAVDKTNLSNRLEEFPEGASLYALINKSFTKARNKDAENRIMLYDIFDVFANHMSSMAQYNAFALPVLDATKWLDYQQKTDTDTGKSVREELTRVFGSPVGDGPGYAVSFIENILKDINGTGARGDSYDNAYLKLLHNANRVQVAWKLKTALLQPLSIIRAGLVVDARSILSALNPADIKQNKEEMLKYSGIAAWKDLGFYDVNISRGMHKLITQESNRRDKFTEKGLWLAEKMDSVAWSAMWGAAKQEVIRKQKLKPGDEGFFEATKKVFDEIIYKTQVVDSVLTKSELMRSKSGIARTASSFMGESVATVSMLLDATFKLKRDGWAKGKDYFVRACTVYVVSGVVTAILNSLSDAWFDDDEYEEWYEKVFDALGGNVLEELDPLLKIPYVGDVWESVATIGKTILNAALGTDFWSYSQSTVLGDIVGDASKSLEILIGKLTGKETKYDHWAWIYPLAQAISSVSGVPGANLFKEFKGVWNNTVGTLYPDLKLKSYDSGDKNEIKYAYQDGYLTDEEAVDLLLEQGLVDNEDEAYFTVQGWEAGDGYSRYDKLDEALRSGTGFNEAMEELLSHGITEKDIQKRAKTKAGEWYRGGEISKQQAINMLTKYTDMDSEEITKMVNQWSAVVVTGIDYEDIGDEFMAGKITASRAIEMYMRYGGMTKEEATEKVTVHSFVKEHPSLDGESISYSFVSAYTEYCEPQGIDVETLLDVRKFMGSAESDEGKRGKTAKEKVLEYIDSLDLSRKQKDALYYASGYAKSTIKDAPWR